MKTIDYLERSRLYRKLIHGPHSEFARIFAGRLLDDQLSRQCTIRSLSLFRDLMDWQIGRGNRACDLNEQHVAQFFDERCRHWHMNEWDKATLRRLLSALRDQGAIPAAPPIELTPQQKLIEAFSAYLVRERGLVRSTIGSQTPHIRRFLGEIDPLGTGDFAALSPEIVIGFIERHALDSSADSGKTMCWSLRAFLRYLHLRGLIATPLADCVPSIRRWRLAGLPTFLPPEKVQQVLDSCDRATPMGLRARPERVERLGHS